MATKQQLGIELSLTLDSKFGALVKQIETAFGNVDLKGFEAKIKGAETKIKELSTQLAKVAKDSSDAIALKVDDSAVNKSIASASKRKIEYAKLEENTNGQMVASWKRYSDAVAAFNTKGFRQDLKETQAAAKDGFDGIINKARQAATAFSAATKDHNSSGGLKQELAELQRSASAGFDKIVSDNKRMRDEINKAYSQKSSQDSASSKAVLETKKAYEEEKKLADKKVNLLNNLQKKEEAITTAIEKGNQKELESTLRKIDAENKAFDAQQQRILRALARYQDAKSKADASSILAVYSREGMAPVNDGYARKSAVNYAKNNSMDDIHVAAIKYGETLKANSAQLKQGEEYLASLAKQGKAHWNGHAVSVQQYAKNIKAMNGELDNTNKTTNTLILSFRRMAVALTEFYMIRGVLFAIRNQLQDVAKTLLDFNQSLYDTAAISGASVSSLKDMETAAFNIATSSRFTATQVMEMTKILAQAGVASKDLAEATKVTALFATGANATPAQAVDLMTTSMNVWDIKAQDSIRIANTLTATLNASKLEAGGLSTAFNYLANQGEQMGMSLEEVSGIIATLSNVGVKPSTIGTGASGLLAAFAAPAPRLRAMLKEFKVGLDEVNPMTHSFAEIIGRLEKAAIPTEAILASLDKRIARTLVSALNAGQEGFELMTRAVTGTDAALIANYKVMEGVRAKFNVIKSEFAESVKSIVDNMTGMFSVALTLLRTFVLGIGTAGGQTAVALGAIAAGAVMVSIACKAAAIETSLFARAIFALKAVAPEVWILTGAFLAVAAAVGAFGAKKLKAKEDNEAFIKGLAATADKLQQGEMGLIGIMNGLDKTQRAQKGYIKLTRDQTTELVTLMNKYPEYLGDMKLEEISLDTLTKKTDELYEARVRNAKAAADQFNSLEDDANRSKGIIKADPEWDKIVEYAKKNKIAIDEKDPVGTLEAIKSRTKPKNGGYVDEFGEAELGEFGKADKINGVAARVLSRNAEQIDTISNVNATKATIKPSLGGNYLVDQTGYANRVPTTPRNRTSDYKAPDHQAIKDAETEKQKATRLNASAEEALNEMKRKLAQLSVEEKKLKLDQLKEDLKTERELVAFKMLSAEAINEEAAAKEVESKIRIKKDLAKALDGTVELDVNGNGSVKANKLITAANEAALRTAATTQLKAEVEAIVNEAALKIDKVNATKLPADTTNKLSKDTTLKDEKIESAKLQKLLFELKVRKESVTSAEELRALEMEELELQKKSAENLEKMYQTRLNSVIADEAKYEKAEEYNAALDTAKDNLDAIRIKLEGIALQHEQMRDKGFLGNLKTGAAKAVVGMGDAKTNEEQLGADLTNTALNGMVTLIDESINKLAKLEWSWKSFRNTLGDVMKDIAAQLQKYYIKLMIIWAAEKLVGLASRVTTTSPDSLGSSGTPGQLAGGEYSANSGGLLSKAGFLRFADGGQVPLNMGTPGQDSLLTYLTPGEIVIKKSSVDYYGADKLLKFNNASIPKFAEGGMVGGSGRGSSESTGQAVTLQIVNVASVDSIPKQPVDAQQVINIVSFDAANRGPTYKTFKGIMAGG